MHLTQTQKSIVASKLNPIKNPEELFDEFIDECNAPFKIGGLQYPASECWKEVDYIAYREEFHNWLDAEQLIEVADEYYRQADIEALIEELDS